MPAVLTPNPLLEILGTATGDPGHVLSRAIDRHANAHDASHFLLVPEAVVVASDAAEVSRLLRASAASGIPLTFRSGGTSLSGQGVTGSVLVDVRRNFRSIDVLDDGARVRVQPGATVRQVNARLARFKRKLGPDPASEIACTIGGVVANNSSGMSCGITANTYRTLESMVVVLASGTVVDTGAADADARLRHDEPALHEGLLRLRDRIRSNPASVRELERQFSMKNTMGYGLNSFLDHDSAAQILAHLVIGSEGTLGFVAEATFRTVPAHAHLSTGLLVFDDLVSANEALPALVESGAAALELMDALSLRVGQSEAGAHPLIASLDVHEHAALLVEYQAETADELAGFEADGFAAMSRLALSRPGELTTDATTRAALWHLRKGLYATVAESRPSGTTALLEDVVVPVASLARTCARLGTLFDRYAYENSVIFGHAKDGNIHFMITDRFAEQEANAKYAAFTEDMVGLILDEGGSLKAEHGTGRVMAPFVRRQYGDELYDVMREVKRLADPAAILNPGVLIEAAPDAHLTNIKSTPTIEVEVDRCVECGYCEPVCPSRDLTLTPRQRIVVKRAIASAHATGDTALARELEHDYEYGGVQTCAVDGMCQTACPVLINTGDLVRRLRTTDHAALETAVWTGAAKNWAATTRIASAALTVAAAVPAPVVQLPNRAGRAVVSDDVLPLWSPELPKGGRSRKKTAAASPATAFATDGAATGGATAGTPLPTAATAVYLPACVNTMFGPADGGAGVQQSLQQLCERAGVTLLVPDDIDSLCCGTPWSSKGLPAGASVMRERVLASLRAATLDGELPVVCDASSCTEGIAHMIEADTREPRMRVVDAVEFAVEHILPMLPDHERLESLVIHPTCSSTRLGTNAALAAVASAVAKTVSVPDDWGCCAFAGDRGMLHPELTASATATQAAQVRALGSLGASAHASCNRTCELGMTRATGKQYRHVLELLADAVAGA
jgi:D-lactate dehydrogenase